MGIIIMKSQTYCRLINLPPLMFLKLRILKTRWPMCGYLSLHFQFLLLFWIKSLLRSVNNCHDILGRRMLLWNFSAFGWASNQRTVLASRDKDQKTGDNGKKSVSFRGLWTTVGEDQHSPILSIQVSPHLAKKPK